MPERIQRKRAKGWKMPENTVCVDRTTPWGNPFKVGVDGTAEECVSLYKNLLSGRICLSTKASIEDQQKALNHAAENFQKLKGKNLACWCRMDKPCHADVLLEIVNGEKK